MFLFVMSLAVGLAGAQNQTPPNDPPHSSARPSTPGVAPEAQPAAGKADHERQRSATLVRGFWSDPATGLTWTADTSKKTFSTFGAASGYCKSLKLGGLSHWRLPTLGDLQGIYDATQEYPDEPNWEVHIKGGISCMYQRAWTNGPLPTGSGYFMFSFGNGQPYPLTKEQMKSPSAAAGALCVRP
jgi:hypothetical protein